MSATPQLAIACFAVFTSVFGLSTGAFAGEGGAAGAASFTVNSGVVTGVAQASAIGKNDAAAGASNTVNSSISIVNSAYALGSAGAITITNIGNPATIQITGSADTAIETLQTNQLSSGTTINIGTSSGDQLIKF